MAKKKEKTLEEKLQEALVPENQWPYMLPENWCWTRLNQVVNILNGDRGKNYPSKKDYVKEGIPFINAGAIADGVLEPEYFNYIGESKFESLRAGKIQIDDILYCLRGSLGKCAIIHLDMKGAISSSLCIMRRKYHINNKYIFYFLNSDIVEKQQSLVENGSAQPNLSAANVGNYIIPLPPLSEQKRIVHRIESLFAKLDEAKEKIQQVLDGAEMRKAAILHKAFTGELTKNWRKENGISEDSWESVKLKELGELNRGKSKHRPRNDPRLFNGPYPFIQTGDVSSSGMYIQKHSQTLSEFGMQQSRLFPKDTLCITIAANIGKVAILTYDCCFPDSVVGFTPNERTFSKYMYYSMLKIQKEIEALAPAVAQKNLSLKLLLDVNVQIPSVEEQHTIVKIIERLLKHEKNVISASMRSIESIETMKKSILAKAFRGELGTNNPTEDSALNLLKEVLQDKS